MDNNKIAGVLEEAARLYKDDKVEWCSGSWVEVPDDYDEDLEIPEAIAKGVQPSMCAEGALLAASGFNWNTIDAFAAYAQISGEREWLEKVDKEASDLFHASREALGAYLAEHRDDNYVTISALDFSDNAPAAVLIPQWNDALSTNILDNRFNNGLPVMTKAEREAKNVVIHAMESAAKDLRNQ